MLSHIATLVLDPQVWLFLVIGVTLGLVVGAIPGLTATTAVTVLLPIAFFLPAHVGIPFLIAITKGAFFAGAIPAILISTPGTAAAAATVLDGYPMARKGQARKALDAALYGSVVGDFLSNAVALVLAGAVALIALRLGPPEILVVMVAGLATIAMLTGGSLAKGLLSAAIGLVVASVGLDPTFGVSRMTFDSPRLAGGFDFIIVVLGLYAVTEVFVQGRHLARRRGERIAQVGEPLSRAEARSLMPVYLRGTGIGIAVGLVPALNQAVAGFLAWSQEKRRSAHPERFGKGEVRGVAASESSNNAVNGPALVPLLTFGIPGDTIAAVLLAALLVHGVSPGPRIFEQHGPLVYSLFILFMASSLVLLVLGRLTMRWVARLADLPMGNLLAFGAVFSIVGAYAVNYSQFEVLVMILFGVLGFGLVQAGIPREPLLITLLLAPMIEASLSQALAMGGPFFLLGRPIALGLVVAFLVLLTVLVRKRPEPQPVEETVDAQV